MSKILIIILLLTGCTSNTILSDVTSQDKGPKQCPNQYVHYCYERAEAIYCRCERIPENSEDPMDEIYRSGDLDW
jgi:hypothetical protein